MRHKHKKSSSDPLKGFGKTLNKAERQKLKETLEISKRRTVEVRDSIRPNRMSLEVAINILIGDDGFVRTDTIHTNYGAF